jgi:hypothetical protein
MPIPPIVALVDGRAVAIGPGARAGLGFLDAWARMGGHDGLPRPVEA